MLLFVQLVYYILAIMIHLNQSSKVLIQNNQLKLSLRSGISKIYPHLLFMKMKWKLNEILFYLHNIM